jgi:exodeoxyribonuclease VII large subunit
MSNQDHLFKKVLEESQKPKEERVFSVSDYLDILNKGLRKSEARIKGEVSSLNKNKGYLFFNLKDSKDESVLNCFMGRTNYDLSGVDLEVGMEVIARGYPKVYKPRGSLTLQTQTLELVGEGALKKAYEELKKKLKKEGIFSKEKKQPLPKFPKKIGVITSLKGGTVIHDFENNLDKFGFQIKAIDTRVEGKKAIKSILKSIKTMKERDIDVLVIMRGGGSLESLQSFDNEALVREVANCSVPVLAGIGHHEDVTLVALAADVMVSTPNAAAEKLNESWEDARHKVLLRQKEILSFYQQLLSKTKEAVNYFSNNLSHKFKKILEDFRDLETGFQNSINRLEFSIEKKRQTITDSKKSIKDLFQASLDKVKEKIKTISKSISANDPNRQLSLGYSIVSSGEEIIRSISQVEEEDEIDIKVSDGTIEGEVKDVKK